MHGLLCLPSYGLIAGGAASCYCTVTKLEGVKYCSLSGLFRAKTLLWRLNLPAKPHWVMISHVPSTAVRLSSFGLPLWKRDSRGVKLDPGGLIYSVFSNWHEGWHTLVLAKS